MNEGKAKKLFVDKETAKKIRWALDVVTNNHSERCRAAKTKCRSKNSKNRNRTKPKWDLDKSIKQMHLEFSALVGDEIADVFESGAVRIIEQNSETGIPVSENGAQNGNFFRFQ